MKGGGTRETNMKTNVLVAPSFEAGDNLGEP
jgi:hypothetical protein